MIQRGAAALARISYKRTQKTQRRTGKRNTLESLRSLHSRAAIQDLRSPRNFLWIGVWMTRMNSGPYPDPESVPIRVIHDQAAVIGRDRETLGVAQPTEWERGASRPLARQPFLSCRNSSWISRLASALRPGTGRVPKIAAACDNSAG